MANKDNQDAASAIGDSIHKGKEVTNWTNLILNCLITFKCSGRPKDEEPHVKRSVKKKKEIVEYLVRVDLGELGIDEVMFEELQELFKMFDMDRDGVLALAEFQKVLSLLGHSGIQVIQLLGVDQSFGNKLLGYCQLHLRTNFLCKYMIHVHTLLVITNPMKIH